VNRRIFRVIMAVTLLASVGFGVPLAVIVRQLTKDEAVVRLEREAARAALDVRPPAAVEPGRVDEPTQEGDTSFTIYNTKGALVAGRGPATAGGVVRSAIAGKVADGTTSGELVVAIPVTSDDRVYAVVRAARPLGPLQDEVLRDWLIMLALAVVILGGATLAARREARRLSRPVEQLAVAVTRLGNGDFTAHADRSGIPEIDDAAEALDATAQQLGRMIERERAFSADASHQLRTPLTGIRLRLENSLSAPPGEHTEPINDALAAVDRLEDTVIDLLALARRRAPARRELDVADVVLRASNRWQPIAAAAGRELLAAADAELPFVAVSEPAVDQILNVLVDNALVHGRGTVRIHAATIPGGVTIDLSDEGPGVKADLEAVFQRHRGEHHGIGLALARSLAEAEGGRLILRDAGPNPRFSLLLTELPS
jgi:signal transduction histidine kinase